MNKRVEPPKQLTIRAEELALYKGVAGLTLIPLHPYNTTSEKGGRVRRDGKRPLDNNWPARSYDSAKVLRECLEACRNIGVRLSAGWLVIDVDVRSGGLAGLAKLCAELGIDFDNCPTVRTGSGGLHIYLRLPPGVKVRDTLEAYPGVEFKSGSGRQVVSAGSIHPDALKHYEWEIGTPALEDAPECPEELLKAIKRPEHDYKATGGGQYSPEQIAKALAALDVTKFNTNAKWEPLMMAVHHASKGDARQEWIEFSTDDPAYADNAEEIGRRWDSLHADKPGAITFRTFHKILADHGAANLQVAPDVGDDFEDAPPIVPDDEEPKATGKYSTKTMSQLLAEPNPRWLVQGLLIECGLWEIYGRFKSGKTFWGVEIACCVATGHDFFDTKVKQGRVLYVIAEGSRKLFAYRLQQWAKERAKDQADFERIKTLLEKNIDVLTVAVPVDVADEVKAFIADNPSARSLVVIDTLFRSMRGDVMNPGDFQKFVNGCDYIRRKLDCGTMFLHHQKRNDANGAFGSVVGEASVDAALKVTAPRKGVTVLKVDILRDGNADQKPWECNIEEREIEDPSLVEGDVSTIGVLVFNDRGTGDPLRAVLQAIREHDPESVEDLQRCLSPLSKSSVERRLRKCRAKEWIAAGSLELTSAGLAQIDDFEDDED